MLGMTPVLESRSAYSAWGQVFSKEYELLRMKTAKGRKSVMDEYGVENWKLGSDPGFFIVFTQSHRPVSEQDAQGICQAMPNARHSTSDTHLHIHHSNQDHTLLPGG
jgi:hypothetical protein